MLCESGPFPAVLDAGLHSLFFAALPFLLTVAAIRVSPFLPYAVGAIVSFALVAACVFLAILLRLPWLPRVSLRESKRLAVRATASSER